MTKTSKECTRRKRVKRLTFKNILRNNLEVVVFIDAAFATNYDKSSQLRVFVLMRDKVEGRANILPYASSKSKRVRKSVLAVELFALLEGYDASYTIAQTLSDIIGKKIDLTLYTDSPLVY